MATKGIFIVPKEIISECFDDIVTVHLREGYSDDWIDVINDDGELHSFFFTPSAKDGDLYITLDSYSLNIVPSKCTTATVDSQEYTSPISKVRLM